MNRSLSHQNCTFQYKTKKRGLQLKFTCFPLRRRWSLSTMGLSGWPLEPAWGGMPLSSLSVEPESPSPVASVEVCWELSPTDSPRPSSVVGASSTDLVWLPKHDCACSGSAGEGDNGILKGVSQQLNHSGNKTAIPLKDILYQLGMMINDSLRYSL